MDAEQQNVNQRKKICSDVNWSTSGKHLDVGMNGARLVNVTSTRYLGVYIDQYLNWNEHIQHILSSARAKIAKIGRLQPLPKKVTSLLYKVFILPIYDYCDVVWMPNSNRYNLLLERQSLKTRIQNKL